MSLAVLTHFSLSYLVLCQLRLDFIGIIGNFHFRVQSLLRFI